MMCTSQARTRWPSTASQTPAPLVAAAFPQRERIVSFLVPVARGRDRNIIAIGIACLLALHFSAAQAATFTTDTIIGCGDMSYEGQDIVVDGATLTINCDHAFNSLSVVNNGRVTHAAGQTEGIRLTISTDVTVGATSSIDVSGRGYAGGEGPGAGTSVPGGCCTGGGGHGGCGGNGENAIGGDVYGFFDQPQGLGSGGGNPQLYGAGGAGGGSIVLTVGGSLQIDGKLSADGSTGAVSGGGGSGGNIVVTAGTLAGTGTISAKGGNGNLKDAGGGGGGRIALRYSSNTFSGTISACGGEGTGHGTGGGAGTIFSKSDGQSVGSLLIDNAGRAGATTDFPADFVELDSLRIAGSATMSPVGGVPGFHIVIYDTATIESGAALIADGRGHRGGVGPGAGALSPDGCCSGGGGYGGAGGAGRDSQGGVVYGNAQAPVELGSGAGNPEFYGTGGAGGGAMRLTVYGTLQVDGTLSADGARGSFTSGGGSGGSILIAKAGILKGTGWITANGAAGDFNRGGGGGGGRIAIYSPDTSGFDPAHITVSGGTGFHAGDPGSIHLGAGGPPVIADIPDGKIAENIPYNGPLPELVGGVPPIIWSLDANPLGMTIDPNSGEVSWLSPTESGSPHLVTIRATDSLDQTDDEAWSLTVIPAPVIADIPDGSVPEGSAYTGPVPQLSQGTGSMAWSLVAGPAGMTIDGNTGVVSWAKAVADDGPHTITIRATDEVGSFDDQQWTLSVTPVAPSIADIFDAIIAEGQLYTGPLPKLLQGTAPVAWALLVFPSGMNIDAATGRVTWSNPTADGNPQQVKIQATNALGSDDETWNLTVVKPPVIADVPDAVVAIDDTYTGPTPVLTQGAEVTWSLALPVSIPGMTIDAATGVVRWPIAAPLGTYEINIKTTNVAGADEESWNLEVRPRCPVIQDVADQFYVPGRSWSGPLPVLLQGTPPISWSLAAGPSGMNIDANTGIAVWSDPVVEGSPYTIKIHAENDCGFAEAEFPLTALLVPAINEIPDETITEGVTYTGPTPTLAQPTEVTWSLVSSPASMNIDAQGVVRWPSPVIAGSPHQVIIRATNEAGTDEEEWNLAVTPPVVADLVVTEVNPAEFAYDGRPAQVTWTVTNQGNADAPGSWQDAVYLRVEGDSGNGHKLAEFTHEGGLTASASYTRTESVQIPAGYQGQYRFVVVADAGDAVSELDREANNTTPACCVTTVLQEQLPDLQIAEIAAPSMAFVNTQQTIAWRVSNPAEGTAAGTWTDRGYLSTDDQLDPATDLEIASQAVNGPLVPGGSYLRTASFVLPGLPGPYWLFVSIDTDDAVAEDNESNNTVAQLLTLEAPVYTATVETSVEEAVVGSAVPLTGTAKRIDNGDPVGGVDVEIRIRHKGTRRVATVTTDSLGVFTYNFHPLPGEAGRYRVYAEHPAVAEAPDEPDDEFVLVGLRPSVDVVTFKVKPGEQISRDIAIQNLGDVDVTGITAALESASPELGVALDLVPHSILASKSGLMTLTLTGGLASPDKQEAVVRISASVGGQIVPVTSVALSGWVVPDEPHVTISPESIDATMIVGEQTVVELTLANDGPAPASDVEILVPCTPNGCPITPECECEDGSWMNLLTPADVGEIPAGESREVQIALLPIADLPLGRYTGRLVVDVDGTTVPVPYDIKAVSGKTGDMVVKVEDEATYWDEDGPLYGAGPLLEGARVRLRSVIDGSDVADVVTGEEGRYRFEDLPAGPYDLYVSAEKHQPFTQRIEVVGNVENEVAAFLPSILVTYEWTVVPVDIEDLYEITIEAVYETYVPKPVLTIEPSVVDLNDIVAAGTKTINFTIENHGLIAAQQAYLAFGTHPTFQFEPLVEQLGDIAANDSIVVPVTITHIPQSVPSSALPAADKPLSPQDEGGSGGDCSDVSMQLLWSLLCGERQWYAIGVNFKRVADCSGPTYASGKPVGGDGPGGEGDGETPSGTGPSHLLEQVCEAAPTGSDEGPGGGCGENNNALECCDQTSPPNTAGHPIYLFSGEFYENAEDLRIKGRGFDFSWKRRYRSKLGPDSTAQGNRWDYAYNIFLERDDTNLVLHDGGGRADTYKPQPDGTWGRDEFFREIGRNPDGTYTLTFANGGRWDFHPFEGQPEAGKIAAIVDRNGNEMNFAYDGAGRLTTITDTLNRDIALSYNDTGFIESITDFAGRQVTYEYYGDGEQGGSAGDLKACISPAVVGTPTGNDFPDGRRTTYTYSTGFADERLNHNLLTITDPRRNDPNDPTYAMGPYLINVYAETTDSNDPNFDRAIRQVWGGDIIDVTYHPQVPSAANGQSVLKAVVNDRMGNVSEHDFDIGNRLIRERKYTGRANPTLPTTITANRPAGQLRPDDPPYFQTVWEYNADARVTKIIHPNGNITENVYESALDPNARRRARGNLREQHERVGSHGTPSDQQEILKTFVYDADQGCGTCGSNSATEITDGLGNTAQREYDERGNLVREIDRIASVVTEYEYNDHGQMTAKIWPDNGSGHRRRDEYRYYETGPMTGYLDQEIIDAGGLNLATTYEYDAVGNVTRITDPRGNDTQYVFNALDEQVRQISAEVADGSGVRYEQDTVYDANGNVIRRDVQNLSDTGELQANTHLSTTYEYEILDNLVRVTEEVDESHHVVTEHAYDAKRNRTLTRLGEATNGTQPNNTVTHLFDERDLLFRVIRADGSDDQSTTQFDYDENGNQVAVLEGLEDGPHTTTHQYDAYSRLVATTDAMGNVTTHAYDENGRKTVERSYGELEDIPGSAGNQLLAQTRYMYDDMDRLVQTDRAFFDTATGAAIEDGWSSTITTYADNSQVIRVENDRGNATLTSYDTANRRHVITDAKGNTVEYRYDAADNVERIIETDKSDLGNPDQVFTTRFEYDNLNRQIATIDNIGNTNRSYYDSRGNQTRTLDALDHEVLYQYDGLNRLIRTIRDMDGSGLNSANPTAVCGDPDLGTENIVTEQSWDDSGRLVTQTDDNGNTTTYVYDGLSRKVAEVYADTTRKDWQFDSHGDNVFWTDANENKVTQTFDAAGRLTRRDVQVGPGVSDDTTFEVYKYDGLNRLTWAEDDDTRVTRQYDSLSRITRETQDLYDDPAVTWPTAVVASVYDGVGNQTELHYPSGRVVTTTYDALNRKKVIADANPGPDDPPFIAEYWYVGPSRVERRDYGNGTRTEYTYNGVTGIPNAPNDFGVKHMTRTNCFRIADGTTIDDRTYAWDRMGNKTQHKDIRAGGPQLTKDFIYDNIYRLVQSTRSSPELTESEVIQYILDGVGNRREVIGGPDAGVYTMDDKLPEPADRQMNQYTIVGAHSARYDANGSLIELSNPDSFVVRLDFLDRWVQASAGVIPVVLQRDALGRLASIIEFGEGAERVVYNQSWQRLSKSDYPQSSVVDSVYGLFIDELLYYESGATNLFVHHNDVYSASALTGSDAQVLERYYYADYGRPKVCDPLGNPLGASIYDFTTLFTGRNHDSVLLKTDYRTRYFNHELGRFLSVDPLGRWSDRFNVGNPYSLGGNNPQTRLDPLGLDTWIYGGIGGSGGLAVGGGIVGSVIPARVENWSTGETCAVIIECVGFGLGVHFDLSLQAEAGGFSGPHCGKSLSLSPAYCVTVGAGLLWGGGISFCKDKNGKASGLSVYGTVGLGANAGGGIVRCNTHRLHCWNTPCPDCRKPKPGECCEKQQNGPGGPPPPGTPWPCNHWACGMGGYQ